MSLLVKSFGVVALMVGVIGSMAACGGAVEDHGCGVAGCGPSDPSPTIPAPTPPSPAPSPDPQEPAPSTPNGGLRGSDVTPENCPAPYHVATDDNRCVWSCSIGTHPDPAGGIECVCQDGLSEVDSDGFGRRICK